MLSLLNRKTAIVVVSLSLLEATSTLAQVIPDGTVNSQVTPIGNTAQIDAGITRGKNVFHSFQSFSVPKGNTAFFNNSANVMNIISRVTGSSASNIDGILKANGSANLFFLNPNGIVFGENARLDIGGAFLGTTANRINFADGTQFSAIAPQVFPGLTNAEPVGVNFSNNSGEIRVTNTGHQIPNGLFLPSSRDDNPPGLQVSPGKTLALVGGDIVFDGGAVYTPGGQLEIGSVEEGTVTFSSNSPRWTLNYDAPNLAFKNIVLQNRSLLDTTGQGNASIGIYGRQINFLEKSIVLMQNQGVVPDRKLKLAATELLNFADTPTPVNDPFSSEKPSGLYTEALSSGSGAPISLTSPSISFRFGATLNALTFSSGSGSDISIKAANNLNIERSSSINPGIISQINAVTVNSGKAGDVNIVTPNLVISDGGRLSSVTLDKGNGGKISINAELVEIFGLEPVTRQGSMLQAGSLGSGDAGSIAIDTSKLILTNGGSVSTTALSSGNGGSLTINAKRSVRIDGQGSDAVPETTITAEAIVINPILRPLFNLPPVPTGNSGRIFINTPQLLIKDKGRISVRNEGKGDAGDLEILASEIIVDSNSLISATTPGGEGGNITLDALSVLLKDSSITASTQQQGTGGNISVNAGIFVSLGTSTISANAENAQGGNIQINALGLFLSPDTQITATSQLGTQFDGNVEVEAEITNFSQDPDLTVQVDLPELYSACGDANNTLLAYYRMGTGGEPRSPITRSPADGGWLQAAKARYDQRHITYVDPETGEIKPLKRVVGWKTNPNGTITFVNDPRAADQYAPAIAAQLKACLTDQQAKAG